MEHFLKAVSIAERSGQVLTTIATAVVMTVVAVAAVRTIAENAASKPAPSGATKNS